MSSTATTTTTMTTTESEPPVVRVVLKPKQPAKKGVKWAADTVDNEHAGKKSSKKCCIYHKPRGEEVSSCLIDAQEKTTLKH